MKKLLIPILLLTTAVAAWSQVSYVSPQTVPLKNVISGATGAQITGCLRNVGQTVHSLTYTTTGTISVQIRLEYSFDSDAATCTTGTWFALSDTATDAPQGQAIGIGAYPFIRINLLLCDPCNGTTQTLNASYSGSSSQPGLPFGFYNPSQQTRKLVFTSASGGASQTVSNIAAPYGSAAGLIIFDESNAMPAGSSISVTAHWGASSSTMFSFSVPAGVFNALSIPIPATPATTVDVRFFSGGASTQTFSLIYYFMPPDFLVLPGIQPPGSANTESTSGVNAAVSKTFTRTSNTQRAHLFSVNAHCSAGTAQVTVTDGATQIYSSAATEVGTTSFVKSWNPALPSSPNNNLTVTLSACGAGNTGTLDVQGSVF